MASRGVFDQIADLFENESCLPTFGAVAARNQLGLIVLLCMTAVAWIIVEAIVVLVRRRACARLA